MLPIFPQKNLRPLDHAYFQGFSSETRFPPKKLRPFDHAHFRGFCLKKEGNAALFFRNF